MSPHLAMVRQFHEIFNCPVGVKPQRLGELPASARTNLERARERCWAYAEADQPASKYFGHVLEELLEFFDAYKRGDLVSQLDALVDAEYCLLSLVVALGFASQKPDLRPEGSIPLAACSRFEAAFARVHAANLAKAEGGVRKNEAGKVLKPAGWIAPDLSDLVL